MTGIQEVALWFTTIKAPDLKPKVDEALKAIEAGEALSEIQRKLCGFMLFSYSMNHGPVSFIGVELTAKEIGVADEMAEYAKDWIDHSKKKV